MTTNTQLVTEMMTPTNANEDILKTEFYNSFLADCNLNDDIIELDGHQSVIDIDLEEDSVSPSPTASCITPFVADDSYYAYSDYSDSNSDSDYTFSQNVMFGEEYFANQSAPKYTILPNFEKEQFKAVEVGSILESQLGIKELIQFNLIHKLMTDECGSRYLQNLLKSYEPQTRECSDIMTALINHLVSQNIDLTLMSEHIYANHFISLLFVHGTDLHHEILLNFFVYPSTLRLCKGKYGCRVIQNILSAVKNSIKLSQLVECFRKQAVASNSIEEYLLCGHTSHAIETIIELKLPYQAIEFIGKALGSDLLRYSVHVYASRAVQAFVRCYADKLDVNKLLLNDAHIYLAQNEFGNAVIRSIIQPKQWYSNLSEIKKFRNQLFNQVFNDSNILYLSQDNMARKNVIRILSNKSKFIYH